MLPPNDDEEEVKVPSEEQNKNVNELSQDFLVEKTEVDPTMLPPETTEKVLEIPQIDIEIHSGKFDPSRVRMLIYGDSGAGKTVFASSWPSPIFLNLDDGLASVKREVASVRIRSWADLQNAYLFLQGGQHNFKTVIVDSLNETQWQAMDATVKQYPHVRRSYGNLPGMSDYGKALDDFDKFVRYMKGLPMNVLFIAQLAKRENEDEMFQPQFTGKSTAQNICRMMDVIGFIYKGDSSEGDADAKKPRIITFDDSKFMAKDRSNKLPHEIRGVYPSPSYEDLAQYWR